MLKRVATVATSETVDSVNMRNMEITDATIPGSPWDVILGVKNDPKVDNYGNITGIEQSQKWPLTGLFRAIISRNRSFLPSFLISGNGCLHDEAFGDFPDWFSQN